MKLSLAEEQLKRPECKHLFRSEAEWISTDRYDNASHVIPEGVPLCSYYTDRPDRFTDMPPWLDRSLPGSANFRYPADCAACPAYTPDPIRERLFNESQTP